MKTLKKIILAIIDSAILKAFYKYFLLYLFRKKEIYYVTGMRRSGNHAFINWLINSIEKKQTELIQDSSCEHFYTTPSAKTIFLNEVNEINHIEFFKIILKKTTRFRNCDRIIISTEDCSADYSSYKVPRFNKAIYVKRSLLNLTASRIQYLVKNANEGKTSYFNAIDDQILNKILTFHESSKFHTWYYDKWLTSENYRKIFLTHLNLDTGLLPTLSKFGGGSSFSGTDKDPNISDLSNRYKQIEFSDKVLEYLRDNKYRDLLNDQEKNFLFN